MTNAIGDILARKKSAPEPEEFQLIKAFVRTRYQAPCQVALRGDRVIVTVSGAALAATLRLNIIELQRVAKLPKRPTIRIGD